MCGNNILTFKSAISANDYQVYCKIHTVAI